MKKVEKRIYIIAGVALVVGLIALTSMSYALWNSDFTQADENTLTPGCLNISFTEENGSKISLTNSYPLTDAAGKGTKGYTFTIKNTCTVTASVSVVLNELNSNTISDDNMKAYVEGGKKVEPTLLSTLSQTAVVKDTSDSNVYKTNGSRIIFEDFLLPASSEGGSDGNSKTYTIKLWIADNANISPNTSSSFGGRISIVSTATKVDFGSIILANNSVQASTPDFSTGSPACQGSHYSNYDYECNSYVDNGTGLFVAPDDDGTSYYFRGAVENNNATFADKNWKILRINGDGSIRLIYNGSDKVNSSFNKAGIKYVGYTYDNSHACTQSDPCISDYQNGDFTSNYGDKSTKDSTIKSNLEKWYQDNLASYDSQIALSTYCNDTSRGSSYMFGAGDRGIYECSSSNSVCNAKPILTCPNPTELNGETHDYGGVYKLKIGLINADEMVMGGISPDWINPSGDNYISTVLSGFSMTPLNASESFISHIFDYKGRLSTESYSNWSGYDNTPVINLKPDVKVALEGEGEPGTVSNPYVIK